MSTLQEKQLQFNPHLVMSNDGGQLSNDSGLLLLFEFFIRSSSKSWLTSYCILTIQETIVHMTILIYLCKFLCS